MEWHLKLMLWNCHCEESPIEFCRMKDNEDYDSGCASLIFLSITEFCFHRLISTWCRMKTQNGKWQLIVGMGGLHLANSWIVVLCLTNAAHHHTTVVIVLPLIFVGTLRTKGRRLAAIMIRHRIITDRIANPEWVGDMAPQEMVSSFLAKCLNVSVYPKATVRTDNIADVNDSRIPSNVKWKNLLFKAQF